MRLPLSIHFAILCLALAPAKPLLAAGGLVFAFGLNSGGKTCMGSTSGNTLIPTLIDSTNISGLRFVEAGASGGDMLGSGQHSHFLTEGGVVFACGTNANFRTGQSGLTGSTTVATSMAAGGTGNDVVRMTVGGAFSLLLGGNGIVYALGAGGAGQTGDGSTSGQSVPTAIDSTNFSPLEIVQVSAGDAYSLVLAEDGTAFSFGDNLFGQTGLGTSTGNALIATAIDDTNFGMLEIVKVAAGAHHALILDENGVVYSFGRNANGRTGLDTDTGDTLVATAIDSTNIGMRSIVDISAGEAHSLLLADDGTVFSFGFNIAGQTGLGTEVGSTLVATAIDTTNLAGKTITRIAAGGNFSLLLTDDGSVFSFGDNTAGQNAQGLTFGGTTIATEIDTTNLGTAVVADIAAGRDHGFVVTELPEPASGALAAMTTLAWLARRRRALGRR